MKKGTAKSEGKNISFRSLVREAMPEMWTFQILAALTLIIPAWILTRLLNVVAEAGGEALTSANLGAMLMSWRTPLLLVIGIVLILWFIVVEVFAHIYMNDDVLSGKGARAWREIGKGLRSVKRFANPTGVLVLLYIFIAVPLCGIGFSISLTESFYIPNFIMEVILAKPLLAGLYAVVILILAWIGYRSIFTVHGVLLGGLRPAEARKASVKITGQNRKKFLGGMLKTLVILILIQAAAYLVFRYLPVLWLNHSAADLPSNYVFDITTLAGLSSVTPTDVAVVSHRIVGAATVLMGGYIVAIVGLLCGAYLMLRLTKYYFEFTKGEQELWPERPKKSRYLRKAIAMTVVFIVILVASAAVGLFYNQLMIRDEPVKIVAHRAGGTMASENSLEGLELAIEHGCYASEIDIQRTKDGEYIINHDGTFERLTGVDKAPEEMTMDEVRKLRIKDTTGNGAELPVVTLDEMLDITKGKEKLFIELKGATADRQMVDDAVAIVRAHDCVSDVALISLNYDIISYAETTYPEFETGTLFFLGIGNLSKLNCDLLIMEEEMASELTMAQIHLAGKQAIVWTVNTEKGMRKFLDSSVDAVITDEIPLAEEIQAKLDSRTDLQVMEDQLGEVWF
ncbi:MAG: glycerophosphodiester phosphodiesterase family protein [Coriobacteriales bacterium]|jgi:glycerophosphoryl diester phosphodiesterase